MAEKTNPNSKFKSFFSNKSNLLGVVILVAALGYGTYNFTKQEYAPPLKFDIFMESYQAKGVYYENEVIAAAKNFGDDVDFKVHFVSQDVDGRLTSPKGDEAFAESLRQLCIQEHYPDDAFMGYLLCINPNIQNSSRFWESCASSNGIDTGVVGSCISSGEAEALARGDMAVISESKIIGSPLFFINGQVYRDPTYESNIMEVVCQLVTPGLQGCSLRKTGGANIILIGDNESALVRMAADKLREGFASIFSSYHLREMDYGSEEAQSLISELNITSLPAVVYDRTLLDSNGYSSMKYQIRQEGDYYIQKTDAVLYTGRPAIPHSLKVFALAECPFSADFVLKQFGNIAKNAPAIKTEIHFIVRHDAAGNQQSLHGQTELIEEMRQVCMMKDYPTDTYYNYLACVSKNISLLGDERQGCADDAGIDLDMIDQCVAAEGVELLDENARAGDGLKITGTPTILINNQLIADGAIASDTDLYACQENPDVNCTKAYEVYSRRADRVMANICYQIPDSAMCSDFVRIHPEVLNQTGPISASEDIVW